MHSSNGSTLSEADRKNIQNYIITIMDDVFPGHHIPHNEHLTVDNVPKPTREDLQNFNLNTNSMAQNLRWSEQIEKHPIEFMTILTPQLSTKLKLLGSLMFITLLEMRGAMILYELNIVKGEKIAYEKIKTNFDHSVEKLPFELKVWFTKGQKIN
jgi:hypothetical protein